MSTVRIALFGHPLGHSRSRDLFAALAEAGGPRVEYLPVDVPPAALHDALERLRAGAWHGANVTVPHKVEAARAVDALGPMAVRAGAVNVLVRDPGGRLRGANTDGTGFVDTLDRLPRFARALVLGAGGASRGIVSALRAHNVPVTVAARDATRAATWCAPLGVPVLPWEEAGLAGAARDALVVQATPVGMAPRADASPPFPFDVLAPGQPVVDIVYNPWETRFLREARARGAVALNGWPMLVAQAARALTHWGLADAAPLFVESAGTVEPRDPLAAS